MSVVIDRELDYQKATVNHGSYQLSKVIQQTGGQTVTVSTTGGEESIFELSPKVFNLARSKIAFAATPLAGGSANYNWFHFGISIRQLQLYTRSGLFLADIPNAHRYLDMTIRVNTKLDDYLCMDLVGDGTGRFEGLVVPNAAESIRFNSATSGGRSYFEPAYYLIGGSNTATPVVNYNFNLGLYHDSIFGLDKDLYFGGEIVYCRIVWESANLWSNISTVTTFPNGGTAGAAAGNVSIAGLTMYLAVEQDNDICNRIKEKVANGTFEMLVPFIYGNKQSLSGTSQNLSLKYNRAHGQLLKKIYWSIYNGTETAGTAWDRTNVAGAKLTTFYTTVNNVRTSQFDYVCASFDDYMKMKDKLKGSCIGGTDEFYFNWIYIEDFTDNISKSRLPTQPIDEQNRVDGMPLENEVKWDVFTTTITGTYAHYIFAITQKTLKVNSAGITLM